VIVTLFVMICSVLPAMSDDGSANYFNLAESMPSDGTVPQMLPPPPMMMPPPMQQGGPRGMMPNPKVGTVTPNVGEAIKAAKGGAIEFRVEKAGVVQAGVGKASFSEEAIGENITAFVTAVLKAKPTGAKGAYVKKVSISSTMGAGLEIDLSSISTK